MRLEGFGRNVANCEVLTDKEARYLLTLYSGTKPSELMSFKQENRTACTGNWELLQFKANSVSPVLINPHCNYVTYHLHITNNADCEIQISELHFCQPEGAADIESVQLQGRVTESVVRLQNQTFKNHPVYIVSFEKPVQILPQYCTPQIWFRSNNQLYNRQVAVLVGSLNHAFNVNGKQIQISLEGCRDREWYCLVAVKMKCASPKYIRSDHTFQTISIGRDPLENGITRATLSK